MSGTLPAEPPSCIEAESESIELLVDARPRDVGGFAVRRLLPSMARRRVGPFVFFDHMGPGAGIDVRPHPHIALATLTYLFEGEIVHRDSVGSEERIVPGDVNWMLAGRGVAHSERAARETVVHGIQSWVALPTEREEDAPHFEHHAARDIPRVVREGVVLDVVAGSAFGARSPVNVLSPTLYVHARLDAGATLQIEAEHAERAVYVISGALGCDARSFRPGTMIVLRGGKPAEIRALEAARVMILGGAPLAGERHIWWNFVSSSKERIERAKDDWRSGRFAKVKNDEVDFIPLPER
jgi:redox-sensitive bicupin YhaK (pirin superfamily)